MATTVVKTIKSGGDYTTLQAWEDACPANLVTSDQVWQGQCAGTFTAGLVISGTTVDSTRYVELTTEAGASFRDNASVQSNALRYNASNGMALNFSGSYANAVYVNAQNYTRLSNLQIQATSTSGHPLLMSSVTGGDVNNCIIEGFRDNVVELTLAGKLRNSLVVSRKSAAANIALINGTDCFNVTFVCPSDKTAATYGFDGRYNTQAFTNCAFFGCGTVGRGGTNTYTTCYTNVGSPPSGCTTLTYDTSAFVNITDATRDYRIPSGSGLIDVGTTDSTNAATDIAGTSRPSGSAYDVGCWEYVAAAAAYVVGRLAFVMQAVNRASSY
jgi:hypothetical protein